MGGAPVAQRWRGRGADECGSTANSQVENITGLPEFTTPGGPNAYVMKDGEYSCFCCRVRSAGSGCATRWELRYGGRRPGLRNEDWIGGIDLSCPMDISSETSPPAQPETSLRFPAQLSPCRFALPPLASLALPALTPSRQSLDAGLLPGPALAHTRTRAPDQGQPAVAVHDRGPRVDGARVAGVVPEARAQGHQP